MYKNIWGMWEKNGLYVQIGVNVQIGLYEEVERRQSQEEANTSGS